MNNQTKKKRKPRKREEAQIQEALIGWSRWVDVDPHDKIKGKIFDYVVAIPNGGQRNLLEAKRLKAQGVKAGVSDLFLAYPIKSSETSWRAYETCGLWLELKSKKGRISAPQDEWLYLMNEVGYATAGAYSLEEAKQAILDYLDIKT